MGLTLDALKKLDQTGRFVPPTPDKLACEQQEGPDESIDLECARNDDANIPRESGDEQETSIAYPSAKRNVKQEHLERNNITLPSVPAPDVTKPDSPIDAAEDDKLDRTSVIPFGDDGPKILSVPIPETQVEASTDGIDVKQARPSESDDKAKGADVVSAHQRSESVTEAGERHQQTIAREARETCEPVENGDESDGVAIDDFASEDDGPERAAAPEHAAANDLPSMTVDELMPSQPLLESPPKPLEADIRSQPSVNAADQSSRLQASADESYDDEIDVDDWAAADNAYSPIIPAFDDLLEDEHADSDYDYDDDLIVVEDQLNDDESTPAEVELAGDQEHVASCENENENENENEGSLGETFTSPLPTFDPYSNRPSITSDSNQPSSATSRSDSPASDVPSLNEDESMPSPGSSGPGPMSAYSAPLPDLDAPTASVPEATMPLTFGGAVLSGDAESPEHVTNDSNHPPRDTPESSSWDPFGTRRDFSDLQSSQDNVPFDDATDNEGEESATRVIPWSPPSLAHREMPSEDVANKTRIQTPVATTIPETVAGRTSAFDTEPDGELTVPTAFEKDLIADLTEPSVETLFTDLAETIRQKNKLRLPATLCVVSAAATSRSADILARLGFVLADDEEQVLLVDCNLVHGNLTAGFDAKNSPGVSEVLAGTAAIDVVRFTSRRNLFVVPTGNVQSEFGKNPQAAPIANLAEMISVWARNYHRVLLDCGEATSPLAQLVGGQAEAAIMIVKHPCPNGKKMDAAVKAFNSFEANCLGCVVSDAVVASEQDI